MRIFSVDQTVVNYSRSVSKMAVPPPILNIQYNLKSKFVMDVTSAFTQ